MYHKIIRFDDNSGKLHASSISVLLKHTKTSCDIKLSLSKNKTYLILSIMHINYSLKPNFVYVFVSCMIPFWDGGY